MPKTNTLAGDKRNNRYFMVMSQAKRLGLVSSCLVLIVSCAKADISAQLSLPSADDAQPFPTATAALQAEPTPAALDYCLDCHADKEQLISTAKPEPPVESESKGVG
jgi:hypothetical protein